MSAAPSVFAKHNEGMEPYFFHAHHASPNFQTRS
jgi:hypothetical protein